MGARAQPIGYLRAERSNGGVLLRPTIRFVCATCFEAANDEGLCERLTVELHTRLSGTRVHWSAC